MDSKHSADISATEDLRQEWNNIGPHFAERVEPSTVSNALRNFETLLSMLPPKIPRLRIIELGCGSGLFADAVLTARAQSVAEYWLVDVSEKMIELARERLRRHLASPGLAISFLASSAERLEQVPSGYFDVAVANYLFHFVPRPDLAFAETRRVLRAGGLFALSSLGDHTRSQRFSVRFELAFQRGLLSDESKCLKMFKYGNPEALARAARQAGFVVRQAGEHLDLLPLTDGFVEENFELFRVYLVKELSEAAEAEIKRELKTRIDHICGPSGQIETLGVHAVLQKPENPSLI